MTAARVVYTGGVHRSAVPLVYLLSQSSTGTFAIIYTFPTLLKRQHGAHLSRAQGGDYRVERGVRHDGEWQRSA